MTPLRTLFPVPAICVFVGIANAASAQAPAAPDQPLPAGTSELVQPVMDRMILVHGILDQFEGRTDGRTPDFRWSGEGWIGTDYDKFWVKTEGFRRSNGTVDDGQHEFLYDRAISTFFDVQAGLRSDIDTRPTRNWAALGFEGLAPLFFNVQGTGYVSDSGHFAARFEASYDLLLTNTLILQPQFEVNLYSKSDPARLVGAGISEIDTGLRLRYELDRKFAPYIGVAYEGKFGQTASFVRRVGENTSGVRFVFGIRSWF
jgi:copper resistance protein B